MLEPNRMWDYKMETFLKEAISEGKSSSVIAAEMTAKFQKLFSRNSVIGKAHRLNLSVGAHVSLTPKTDLSKKRKPTVKKPHVRAIVSKIVKSTKNVNEKPPIGLFKNPKALGVEFVELRDGMCKFPVGELKENTLRFCGAPADAVNSRTYCKFCYSLVYIPMRTPVRISKDMKAT